MGLGWLFLKRTDKQGWFRNVVIVFAIMLATAILLSAMAFGNAVSEQMRRGAWKANLLYNNRNRFDGNLESLKGKTLAQLTVSGFGDYAIQELGIRQIDKDSPLLPNLSRQPGEKELFVSKSMMDLIKQNPLLKERYLNYELKIAVPDSLLATPNQRWVIYRLPDEVIYNRTQSTKSSPLDLRIIDSEDIAKADEIMMTRTQLIINVFMALCGIGVCFPLLILVISATRVGMMQREQRYAALSLIGTSKRQINQIILAETLTFAGLAVLLGSGLYQLLKYTVLANLKLGDDVMFLSDFVITPVIFAAVIGLVLLIAIAVNWIALSKVKTSPLGVVKNQKKLRKPTVLGLLPMLIAIVGICVINQLGPEWFLKNSDSSMFYFIGIFVALMVGLLTSGSFLTYLIAKLIDRFSNRATSLMSSKRMQMFARPIFSSVSGVVLALFVGSFFITITASVKATYREIYSEMSTAVALANTESNPNALRYTANSKADFQIVLNKILADEKLSSDLLATKTLRHYYSENVYGNIYTCDEVAKFTRLSCPSDYQSSDEVIFYNNHLANESKLVKLDADLLKAGTIEDQMWVAAFLFKDAQTAKDAILKIQNIIAVTMYETGQMGWLDTNDEAFDPLQGIEGLLHAIMAGTVMTILVAGFSLAVATIGAFFERKKSFYNLRLMGTDIKMLNRVVMIESFVPLALASLVAIVTGILTARYMLVVMSTKAIFAMPGADYFVTVVVSLLATVIIILSILPILKKITSFEENRSE